MGFRHKLLGFGILLLSVLSFCLAQNVTFKVMGQVHCIHCFRNEFSSSQSTSEFNVSIHCESRNKQTKTQGNGAVDDQGTFNIALYTEITKYGHTIDGCFAKLQSTSTAPCPIKSPQTASVKLLSSKDSTTQPTHSTNKLIQFSPLTCQSAFFFWPFPYATHFPPSSQPLLPPIAHPVQPTPPPVADMIPSPLYYSPPFTSVPSPQNLPNPTPETPSPPSGPISNTQPPILPPQVPSLNEPIPSQFCKQPFHLTPSPAPGPIISLIPPPAPKFTKPTPPPSFKHTFHPTPAPSLAPILSPIPPPQKKPHFHAPISQTLPPLAPPAPLVQTPYPPPSPQPGTSVPLPPPPHKIRKPIPPPFPVGIPIPPNHGKPSFIPRAPPVPHFPPVPASPRKYFKTPKTESQPPHPSHPSHS